MERIAQLLLDTNLLLLWLVSRTDPTLLRTYKRVQMFTYQDILLLRRIASATVLFVSTPHILAEASNFVDQAPTHRRAALIQQFKVYIADSSERHQPASALCGEADFDQLGLTDTAILDLASEALVVTMDHRLAGRIRANHGLVHNFNDLRKQYAVSPTHA